MEEEEEKEKEKEKKKVEEGTLYFCYDVCQYSARVYKRTSESNPRSYEALDRSLLTCFQQVFIAPSYIIYHISYISYTYTQIVSINLLW